MRPDEIEAAVLKVLSSVLRQDFRSAGEAARSNTPSWDSLKHVEIVFAIEEEFGIQFTDEELKSATDAMSLAKLVEGKYAS